MPLAAEIAADEPGRLATAAHSHRGQTAGQVFFERSAAVEEGRRRAVRNSVGIAVGDDQNIPGGNGYVLFTREAHHRLAIGDQVIADQPLGPGGEHVGNLMQVRHLEPPRGRALRVVEDGASHAHRRQRIR